MPNRILREAILTSEPLNRVAGEPAVEVFYRRLHSVADDYGRFSANPQVLRAACYPLRFDQVSNGEVSRYLAACASAELIRLYRVDTKPYLEVLRFRQKTRAKNSKYPSPEGHTVGTCDADDQQMASICGPRVLQMVSTCDADDVHMRTETEAETCSETDTYSDTEACSETRADGAIPPDEFFEERFRRHPKKNNRILAQQYLAGIPKIETSQMQDEFRQGHEAWLATDDYQWKGGAKAPTLAAFISDQTWRYAPPEDTETGKSGGDAIGRAVADWRRSTEKEAA